LCVPKRELYITGKDTARESHLTEKRTKQILKAGGLSINKKARKKLSKIEIFELLKSPLSPTRATGVRILEEREINCVDELIEMLDDKNPYARYGAAQALGRVGFANKAAAEKMISLMETDKDMQFKVNAILALTSTDQRLGLLAVAKPAIPVLLRMAVQFSKDDPRKVLQNQISRALFYNGRAEPRRGLLPMYGLEGVDRKLLITAVKELLTNQNGWGRSMVGSYLYPLLTEKELDNLWVDVYKSTRYIAPSGIMFAPGIRIPGLKLLSKHKIKEGIDLAAWYIRWQKGHGAHGRVPNALAALESYGTHAKAVVPYLKEHAGYYISKRNPRRKIGPEDTANRILESIKKIESSVDTPQLKSISDRIDKSLYPPHNGP
jgi:hypothetical protein